MFRMVALIVARKVFGSVDVLANVLAFRTSHDLLIPSDESIVPVTLGVEVDIFTVSILLGGCCRCCCRRCCGCCRRCGCRCGCGCGCWCCSWGCGWLRWVISGTWRPGTGSKSRTCWTTHTSSAVFSIATLKKQVALSAEMGEEMALSVLAAKILAFCWCVSVSVV